MGTAHVLELHKMQHSANSGGIKFVQDFNSEMLFHVRSIALKTKLCYF